jgi:hypothetical protein
MGSVVEGRGTSLAEPRRAADCLQRPRRARFRQQLTAGVGMTSDVKSERKNSSLLSSW